MNQLCTPAALTSSFQMTVISGNNNSSSSGSDKLFLAGARFLNSSEDVMMPFHTISRAAM